MALKIIHVMEFQILFAQILFFYFSNIFHITPAVNIDQSSSPCRLDSWDVLAWATFANQLHRKRFASWMLLQHLA